MNQKHSIAVYCQQDDLRDYAEKLAQQLDAPLLTQVAQPLDYKYLLVYSHNDFGYALELQFPAEKLNPVKVDFTDQQLQYRQKFGGGRQQAIAKAVGLKRGYIPNLLDGTAGLGKDAFILASLNCKVTMCERNSRMRE